MPKGISIAVEFFPSFKALFPDFTLKLKYPLDAGYDVIAPFSFSLAPGARLTIPLGFKLQMPSHIFATIEDKSGLAMHSGIHVLGQIIDSNYRGEIHAIIQNLSPNLFANFFGGEAIAQLIFHKRLNINIVQVNHVNSDTMRGEKGLTSQCHMTERKNT